MMLWERKMILLTGLSRLLKILRVVIPGVLNDFLIWPKYILYLDAKRLRIMKFSLWKKKRNSMLDLTEFIVKMSGQLSSICVCVWIVCWVVESRHILNMKWKQTTAWLGNLEPGTGSKLKRTIMAWVLVTSKQSSKQRVNEVMGGAELASTF